MRHAQIVLTALTLVITSLSTVGCAQTKTKSATPTLAASATDVSIIDPSSLFNQRTGHRKTLRVRAMAYTGCSARKGSAPRVVRGAWGDRLTSEVKAVAVSPDLLKLGIEYGNTIQIEGLPGEYKVLDLMHGRHAKAIDIYYGDDHCGARAWGARNLTISWQ